jgi:hypothetical protein
MQTTSYVINKYGVQIGCTIDRLTALIGTEFEGYRTEIWGVLAELIIAEANSQNEEDETAILATIDRLVSFNSDLNDYRVRIWIYLADLLAEVLADVGYPCPKCDGKTETHPEKRNGIGLIDVMVCQKCGWQKVL